jgi:hypothetical protein
MPTKKIVVRPLTRRELFALVKALAKDLELMGGIMGGKTPDNRPVSKGRR